jgi:glycosyltransferase involved in cell wall biosynthesis
MSLYSRSQLMRVCMVSPHLPPEQAAVALLPVILGDTLSSSDVTASYISHPSHAPAATDGRDITYIARRGRGALSRSKLGAFVAGARMIARARHAIARSDLVHLHSNGLLIEVGAWLARRYRKPYVITLYGTDISAHDSTRNARYGNVVRSANARVFYSKGLLERAAQLDLAPNPSLVIYAPVSSDFHPVDEHVRQALRQELGANDGPALLTVKHLRPVGGHETLLRAMPAILRAHPNATLWLAGDGDQRAMLESTCRDLGITPHVRFLGRLSNDSVWKYYAAADLFVLPSHVESWGTVMLEAMACGTPVVTSTRGSMPEVAGDAAILVDPTSVEAIGAALVRVLSNPDERARLIEAGQRRARQFSWEASARATLDLLIDVRDKRV